MNWIIFWIVSLIPFFGCSSVPKNLQTQAMSHRFVTKPVLSLEHHREVSSPQIEDQNSGKVVLPLAHRYLGFEWVQAHENDEGTIAALDYSIEGRVAEIPLFLLKKEDASWTEIKFQKPHFSGEVTQLSLSKDSIRLRLEIEPGLAAKRFVTSHQTNTAGNPIDISDWEYSFSKKTWSFSKTPLRFHHLRTTLPID